MKKGLSAQKQANVVAGARRSGFVVTGRDAT